MQLNPALHVLRILWRIPIQTCILEGHWLCSHLVRTVVRFMCGRGLCFSGFAVRFLLFLMGVLDLYTYLHVCATTWCLYLLLAVAPCYLRRKEQVNGITQQSFLSGVKLTSVWITFMLQTNKLDVIELLSGRLIGLSTNITVQNAVCWWFLKAFCTVVNAFLALVCVYFR